MSQTHPNSAPAAAEPAAGAADAVDIDDDDAVVHADASWSSSVVRSTSLLIGDYSPLAFGSDSAAAAAHDDDDDDDDDVAAAAAAAAGTSCSS